MYIYIFTYIYIHMVSSDFVSFMVICSCFRNWFQHSLEKQDCSKQNLISVYCNGLISWKGTGTYIRVVAMDLSYEHLWIAMLNISIYIYIYVNMQHVHGICILHGHFPRLSAKVWHFLAPRFLGVLGRHSQDLQWARIRGAEWSTQMPHLWSVLWNRWASSTFGDEKAKQFPIRRTDWGGTAVSRKTICLLGVGRRRGIWYIYDIYKYIYIYKYMHTHTHTYIYIYKYMHTHTYIYIYRHRFRYIDR